MLKFVADAGEMAGRLRTFDWEAGALGSPASWPESLRTALSICLDSQFAMALWWGPDLIQFYNDAYRPILGASKHPGAFGQPARGTWPEIWPTIGPMVEQVMLRGQSVRGEDMALQMDRNGYPERCFFTFSYSPIRDAAGNVVGMFTAAVETTSRVNGERRQAFQLGLSDLIRGLSAPSDITGWACRLLGEYLQATRVGYADVDQAASLVRVSQGWTDGSVTSVIGSDLPLAGFGSHMVSTLRAGLTVRLDDVMADPRCATAIPVFAHLRVRAMLIVPLLKAGVLIAVVSVAAALPRRWSDQEVTLAEDVAERTRAAVERAIAEQALKRRLAMERDRLQELFDQAPGFMAVMRGPAHVFELVNDAYRRLVGHRDLIGRPVREAVPEAEGQGLIELLDQVYATGTRFSAVESPLLLRRSPKAAPEQRYLEFVFQPIAEADGTISGIFVEGHDVTERKLAGDALREADRRKDEFLAMLAHELRNPLAPISAASQLLQGPVRLSDARLKRTGEVIARQVQHMTGLVDDLLDVSRVTRGLITLDQAEQSLQAVAAIAVEQASPAINARHHALRVDLPHEPLLVTGDQKRLVQILANLLNNAAKYTPEGGNIRVHAERAAQQVVLHVTDDGIGIAPNLRNRMFDLFAQAERSSDRAQGGLGLGLALVKNLTELHGGKVTCSSDGPGTGSTFSIALPLSEAGAGPGAPPKTPGHALPSSHAQADGAAGNGRQREASSAAKNLHVLIVDDNADAAQMLEIFLTESGFRVEVELDSRQALERARCDVPDVCLIDIGMPEIDGNALARLLRAEAATAGCTLIAITGYGQTRDKEEARAAGFNHHFVKPVELVRLLEVLADIGTAGATVPG